ncbi:MAG: N-acetyltransferase [Clostridiales bacterium]
MVIEKAKVKDGEAIYELINFYAQKGLMLPKSRTFIYEHLRQYMVVKEKEDLIAVGGLRIFWDNLAEICSLAVDDAYRGQGIGQALLCALEEEAGFLELRQVFSLTYQVGFFQKCGYRQIPMGTLPLKIWKDCGNCKKKDNCDETAMLKLL